MARVPVGASEKQCILDTYIMYVFPTVISDKGAEDLHINKIQHVK